MPITIKSFSLENQNGYYVSYKKLRNKIFSRELGWKDTPYSSAKTISDIDSLDKSSKFIGAFNRNTLVGICRVTPPLQNLQYEDIYAPHYDRLGRNNIKSKIGYLNSLAVDKKFRGKEFENNVSGKPTKISVILVLLALDLILLEGGCYVLCSSSNYQSKHLFEKLSFTNLGKEYHRVWSPGPLNDFIFELTSSKSQRDLRISIQWPVLANEAYPCKQLPCRI